VYVSRSRQTSLESWRISVLAIRLPSVSDPVECCLERTLPILRATNNSLALGISELYRLVYSDIPKAERLQMNLSKLRALFDPLSKVGHTEKLVVVEGVEIKLKTLTSKEEADVQKALSSLREEENVSTAEFVDAFRRESLCRAIVEVGGERLTDPMLETGEVLENGVAVKVKREEAIAEIIKGFSRVLVTHLFQELALMSEVAEKKVTQSLPATEGKVEEERKELEGRLDALNKSKEMDSVSETTARVRQAAYSSALSEMG